MKTSSKKIGKFMQDRARELRVQMTPAEIILWQYLKSSQLNGFKFRRQQPIGQYVVDFYCPTKKLAIEIDGISHDFAATQCKDEDKDRCLASLDIRVIRFTDDDIRRNLEGVLQQLRQTLGG